MANTLDDVLCVPLPAPPAAYGAELPDWNGSPAGKGRPAYLHTFPSKWMSVDRKEVWCVFDRGHQFNLARCTLDLSSMPEVLASTSKPMPQLPVKLPVNLAQS